MMRRRVVIPALLLSSLAAIPNVAVAQYGDGKAPPVADASQRFSAEQIDNLAGPVALYPDALLAQVLVAATFPDQVQDAADFVKENGTDNVDNQSWDVSVKAVAHYPSALNAMADKIDWTAALGKAYASQSSDVMASVQRLRRMASQQGNLNSTPQQNIVRTNETVQIVPVEPRVIYVPVYDPYVIYSRPIFSVGFTSRYWSWGVGFPIGSWLIYDCDWGLRRVYYNGWSPSYYAFGGGWRQRSRPFIQVTNIYINPRYTNVYVNRNVVSRSVNYYNVDRYASVHSGRHFDTRHDGRYDPRDNGRPDNRYAVRNDGAGNNRNDGGSAVRGGGYRSGNQNVSSDDRNNGGSNDRANTPRDGSGYGGRDRDNNGANRNDGNYGGNRDANGNGSNRDGNGNRDVNGSNGNRDNNNRSGNGNSGNNNGGNNNSDARDGNGNRIRQGNPRGQPPQERRSEPSARSDNQPQLIMPRRNEPQQPVLQTPEPAQSQVSVPQRSAEPRSPERSGGSGRFNIPQQPQAAPEQRRSEPARSVQPQVVRPERGGDSRSSSGEVRSARPRGGNL